MSGNLIQLNIVGIEGKKIPLVLDKNLTVRDLFKRVSSNCGIRVMADELRLIYQGEELDGLSEAPLSDQGLQHNGHLYMVVRVKGGFLGFL